MARKKKSLNDLIAQMERIQGYSQARNNPYSTRMGRAYDAFNRYFDNIVTSKAYKRAIDRSKAKLGDRTDYWTPVNTTKFSYRGLSNG